MNTPAEDEIIAAEERLRQAMLASDVGALDELIADDLIFTDHTGQRVAKQDDLQMHRSGAIRCNTIDASERTLSLLGDEVAVVSVLTRISGVFRGAPAVADLRFTRVWRRTPSGSWQIAAGHSSVVS
jgi:ketosteroid isomerase-like protein